MTKIVGDILQLDLKEDQHARNVAFRYATDIMTKEPNISLSILKRIRNIESPNQEEKRDGQ